LSGAEERRESEEKETTRLEAFSDGVFAIAITLLVLDLKVPQGVPSLGRSLFAQWPSYLAFSTSFATIGIMWLNHHRLFNMIRRVDHMLLIWNGLLLFGVSIVPFPTRLVADYLGNPGEKLAVGVYAGVAIYIALAFTGLWRYASSAERKPQLLRVPPDAPEVLTMHAQYRYGPLMYVLATALSLLNAHAGFLLMLAIAVFFLIPPREKTRGG
jgi:uncharacterized membrane protein